LVGVRLISAPTTDAQEAQAMTYQMNPGSATDRVHINSNSWGPADDGLTLEGPGPLTLAAFQSATTTGRGGKGTIFTWACGNGGTADNANYDGYANSRYTIAVAASGGAGQQSSYSEQGSDVVVNTCSNYSGGGITTTDRTGSAGYEDPAGDYTYTFGGTSSACPLAAGCIALMLQANPNLGWRDVQYILANTSTKNSPADAGWIVNGAGKKFNHKFGFGRLDATAAVAAATTWVNVPAEATPLTATESPNTAIPDNNATGITRTLNISGSPNFKVEHVVVTVNATHTWRGDLEMFLTSPSGTVSNIAATRSDSGDNYSSWPFMTVANWGENPNGIWSLKVADRFASDTGTLNSWTITIYGYTVAVADAADWALYE
ncbi:MAG: proprotein convertase P-domain-containing protein, partial [Candidatus Sumerlaeaceae bacterium]|nr:proprotein convertase P-domain-containing protein [Candidatus Sumerlaeaceae bacterium]